MELLKEFIYGFPLAKKDAQLHSTFKHILYTIRSMLVPSFSMFDKAIESKPRTAFAPLLVSSVSALRPLWACCSSEMFPYFLEFNRYRELNVERKDSFLTNATSGRYVGKHAARKYVPGSATLYAIKSAPSQQGSLKMSALKKPTIRRIEDKMPLYYSLV